jgi:hypothetical protein
MSRRLIIGFAAVALSAPAAAYAQGGGLPATAQPVAVPRTSGDQAMPTIQVRGGIVARPVEAKITTGRPYSAETITETTQLLGDGTRISRRTATKVFRDGEGRTRREMFDDDGSLRSVSISDPVAHVNYTLDPKTKTAFKTTINTVAPSGMAPMTREGVVSGGGGGGRGGAIAGAGARGGGGGGALMRTPAPENPNVKKEDLAPQNMEGVMAAGTRTTTVIPAGEIGNDKEIRVVSEQWFSDDLQVLVMTRHSDPRSGETVYRLQNILRAEPDQNLFTVPSDYTVQERSGGRGRGGQQ